MMIVIAFFLKQLRKELSEGGVYSSFSLFTLQLICLNSWGSRKCSLDNSKRSRYDYISSSHFPWLVVRS